jgi:DNA-binding HxlR family transcriptional regulator
MENEYKKKILKTLKDMGRLPFYRIMGIVGGYSTTIQSKLNELEKEGLIVKEIENLATYYKLKEAKA